MLNFALMRNPLNWIIIGLMLIFWAFLLDLGHSYVTGRNPAEPSA